MNKKLKRVIAVVLAGALTCGGVYGGLLAYRKTNTSPVNVYSVSEIAQNTYYYYDEEQSYGSVTSDRVQSCFLSSSQTVKEVLVTQGQEVKVGDALYTYDTTLSDIKLARAENDYEQQKLTLQHAEEDLEKINRLRPSSEDSGEGGGDETPEEPDSTPEEPEETYDPEETNRLIGGSGTKLDPYVFLWSFDDILSDEELIYLFHGGVMPETAGSDGTDSTDSAASVTAFRIKNPFVVDVFGDEPADDDDEIYWEDFDDTWIDDDEEEDTYIEPEIDDTEPSVDENEEPDVEEDSRGEETVDDDDEAPDSGVPGADSTVESDDDALTPEEETDSSISDVDPGVVDIGDDMDVFVVLEVHQYNNSEAPLIVKYGLHMFRVSNRISVRLYNPDAQEDDGSSGDEEEGGEDGEDEGSFDGYDDYVDYGGAGEGSDEASSDSVPTLGKTEIDMNASYTAKEIADMKTETEKTIRDTTIAVKKAEITLREMKAEMSDGTVRSKLNGIVKTVRDPDDAYNSSSAVVQVSGGGGYYVSFNVSELDLANLDLGQEVTVNSYDTGNEYTGTLDSISDYPNTSSDYFFGGNGNPNSSYYPCKVYLSDEAEMRDDDFVGISYSTGSRSSGLFIESMFVRTATNGSYVYVQDEDGKLRKRNVQVGTISNEATEIRSGIKATDYIAFPYGSDCVDGAATKQASYDELYSSYG